MTVLLTVAQVVDNADEPIAGTPSGFARRWGAAMARYRWMVIGVWLVVLSASAGGYRALDSRLESPDYGVDHAESTVAQSLISTHFPERGDEQDVIVFDSSTRTVEDAVYRRAVADALSKVRQMPGVAAVVGPFDGSTQQISQDRRTAVAMVDVVGDPHARSRLSGDVQHQVAMVQHSGVTVAVTGYSPLAKDLTNVENSDLERAESIGIPVALMVLVLALGTIVAAVVPVVSALAALLTSFGAILVLSQFAGFDSLVVTIATMVGTGVSIDYALFVVSRFREELARSDTGGLSTRLRVSAATSVAVGTAGKTITASGLIVMISLCSLMVINAPIFREIAIGVALTVMCTLAVGLTLLPAILAVLGPRVNRGALPKSRQPADTDPSLSVTGYWGRWARRVMRRPIIFGTVSVVVLVLGALPLASIRYGIDLGTPSASGTPSGRAAHLIADKFSPGLLAPIDIVSTGTHGQPLDPAGVTRTNEFVAKLSHKNGIASVFSEETKGRILATGVLSVPIDSTTATDLIAQLRAEAGAIRDSGGPTLQIGGVTAAFVDLSHEVTSKLVIVIALVLAMSFVFLIIVFRRVTLSVQAILMNLLSTAAAIGITVAVFQWGHGASILNFTSTGFLQAYLPIMVFAVVFGLSMDYEVFLIRRIQEHWDLTGHNTSSVALGIEHTARPITAAAAIMVAIFGSFLTADVLELKQFGLALAAAVALDAALVRLVLVPALMRLFGDWNWWMPFTAPRPRASPAAKLESDRDAARIRRSTEVRFLS